MNAEQAYDVGYIHSLFNKQRNVFTVYSAKDVVENPEISTDYYKGYDTATINTPFYFKDGTIGCVQCKNGTDL